MKKIIPLLIFIVGPGLVFGQKQFYVTFVFPDSTTAKKMSFYYYDSEKEDNVPVTPSIKGSTVTVSHTYSTVKAQVAVEYGEAENWRQLTVFTNDKPASVNFTKPFDAKAPFSNYKLVNAQDYKKEIIEVEEYVRATLSHYLELYDSISRNPQAQNDSIAIAGLKEAKIAIGKKRMEYMQQHADSYYTFAMFDRYSKKELPPVYALQQFNTLFPATLRESEQGRFVNRYLSERVGLEVDKKAPNFTTKDINNNPLSLKDLYSKKAVLLVFWGTWCGPCIQEIPLLKEFRDKYPEDKFEIISVATTSPEDKTREIIKEKEMNWIHILNDASINKEYHVGYYPTMFVIDTKGNFVYSAPTILDGSLDKLKEAIAVSTGAN
jgi:peroxiredoxin